ncbi:DUF2231 domain-containing protein [Arsenicicoccus dermatophilus]|uniref:DUF2231 domain-containing protein n=1 Tax=Arsenicicoccus dermatophilus TaxID=1076331 RepID=UPI003916E559
MIQPPSPHVRHQEPSSPLAPALRALEDASALDPVVDLGDRVAEAVTSSPAVRDALRGAWLGHALHPLLIEVPMGTWTSAAVLDLAGGESARDGARLLTGVGLLAAVPAALSGWAEYAGTDQSSRRVGVIHAGANAVGAGLQLASWSARRDGRHRLGAALGMTALGVVGVAGYLGGHLAVARKVGTHDPSFTPDAARNAR